MYDRQSVRGCMYGRWGVCGCCVTGSVYDSRTRVCIGEGMGMVQDDGEVLVGSKKCAEMYVGAVYRSGACGSRCRCRCIVGRDAALQRLINKCADLK